MRGKTLVRGAQRGLRVKPGLMRGGDDVEEEIAEEVLIVDVERQIEPRRDQLHARGTLLHALGREQGRQHARNATEQGGRFVAVLLPLDALPLGEQLATRRDLRPGEHVRMPADELLVQPAGDLVRVERGFLASELRVQGDLQEQVAELVAKAGRIAGIKRGERFVRLLEKVRPQRCVGLLAVPGAAIRRAQPLHDSHHGAERGEIGERLERRQHQEPRRRELGLRDSQRQRALAIVVEQEHGVILGITLCEDRPIRGYVESHRDRSQGREGMPVQAARRHHVDSARPASEDAGERATRTRDRG